MDPSAGSIDQPLDPGIPEHTHLIGRPISTSTPIQPDYAHNTSSSNLRPQISRQKWEELRPLIRRLYIEENKTLSYIANVLAETHNFRPTKKQFTSRITEWGFKKNFKRSERGEFLQNLGPLEGDIRIDLRGRRVQQKRLDRWDKEKRRAKTAASVASVSTRDPETFGETTASKPLIAKQAVSDELGEAMKADIEVAAPATGPEALRRVWVRNVEDEEYKLLPHAKWMNADVLNSPDLSRLIKGLDLDIQYPSEEIEPLTLSTAVMDHGNGYMEKYISCSQLTLGPQDAISTLVVVGDEGGWSDWSGNGQTPIGRTRRRHLLQSMAKPFNELGGDALFPSGIQVERPPSPFNELYPFPSALGTARFRSSTLSQSRQIMTSRLRNKLTLLARAGVSEKNPGVLGLTNRLADVAYDSGKMTEANDLYRKVLASQRGDITTWSEKALHAQVGLIDGLCREGHPLEAKEMLEGVAAAMAKRFDPFHIIRRRLQKAKIEIFNWMEDWDQEEPMVRDLVQICLVNLGARDAETLNAVYRLASVMMGKGRSAESERLHQTTIELCQEGTEKHQERMCWSFTGLGRVYESQGKLDEAIKLLDGSSKKSAQSLGDENEAVMISNYRLARILARRGLLKESEDLLHNTLRLQTKVLGEAHINPMCTMFELGWTLQQRKQYSESAYWLEKCFRKSLSLSNFEFITRFSTQLGSCYEEQGLYEKALAFYNETMDFLRSAKEKGNGELLDVDQYVANIQALIDEASKHVKNEAIVVGATNWVSFDQA